MTITRMIHAVVLIAGSLLPGGPRASCRMRIADAQTSACYGYPPPLNPKLAAHAQRVGAPLERSHAAQARRRTRGEPVTTAATATTSATVGFGAAMRAEGCRRSRRRWRFTVEREHPSRCAKVSRLSWGLALRRRTTSL